MDCKKCSTLLSLYLDGELSDSEQQAITRHLEQCPPCQQEFETLKQAVDCVGRLECVEPPDDFHKKLMNKIRQDRQPNRIWLPFWGSLTIGSMAAAALLLIALIYNPFGQAGNKLPDLTMANQAKQPTSNQPDNKPADQQWENFHSRQVARSHGDSGRAQQASQQPAEGNLIKTIALGGRPDSITQVKQSPASSRTGNRLTRQDREWSGEDSAITAEKLFVINNQQEANAVWQQAAITPLPITNLDWKTSQLVALFVGEKAGRGHEIQLKNIIQDDNRLLIQYLVRTNDGAGQTGTSRPFLVFEMKKTSLPVSLSEIK